MPTQLEKMWIIVGFYGFFCNFATMKQKIITLLIGLLSFTSSALAQTGYRQRQLTMDDGLQSNQVRAILQDERGFIWIGTQGGLCRYDGVVLHSYPMKDIGSSQSVAALQADGKNGLYLAVEQHVYHFAFDTEQFELLPIEQEQMVTSLFADAEGNLWISTDGWGVVKYTPETKQIKQYALGEIGGKVGQVYVDADNQVWALTNQAGQAVWRLNKSKDAFQAAGLKSDVPYGSVSMLQDSNGQRWLGTWEHGLMRMHDDGTLEPMPAPTSGDCLHIHAMRELSDQQLLVGSDDGLWLFDEREHTFQSYLPQRFVNAVALDREGGLWVGTFYGGVTYVSPIARRFDAVQGGITARFCEDRYGHIWVASDDRGVGCYQQGRYLESFPGHDRLSQLNAHALCVDGDDLWMGTFTDGVYVLQISTGRLRHYEALGDPFSLPSANASALLRDHRGRMWVATVGGLCRYDRSADRFEHIMNLGALPVDMEEDAGGRVWISTQGDGLYRYDPDGQTMHYLHADDNEATLADNLVNCALIDSEGTLWAGTQNGLCRYDAEIDNFRYVRLDVPKQAVASIVEDEGVLWLSGDCGVLKYMPGQSVQRFTRHDGLVSEQFQTNACLKSSDGRIYFGTIRGFNSFYPYQIKVNQQLPPVYITGVEIYNHPVEVGSWRLPVALSSLDRLDIWSDDHSFSLAFASLSYCSPEKNIYAYMLEGFDKEWQYVGHDHKATYTNLPTGTYTFRVRATNNDGIWSDHEASLVIEVHPPRWWSLPAKIFYVLLAIGLIWLLLQWRLKGAERRHKKEMALLSEAKEQEVREARMKFFTMIAHEIRTPVSLIIGPLEQLKEEIHKQTQQHAVKEGNTSLGLLDTIDRNAHRLLELVNQLLDFRKIDQSRQEVSFSVQNIPELLRSTAEGFRQALEQGGHHFKVVCPEESFTAVVDRDAIVKVVSNLLSNAKKYTRDSIELRCKLQPGGQQFCIEVEDNGLGIDPDYRQRVFDPFFQTKGSKPGTGLGLSIVKHVVDIHHGKVEVDSEQGQGTTFRVLFPVSQEVATEQPADTSQPAAEQPADSEPMTELTTTEKKPTLLIIDDNEEMLTFLVTTFMDNYEVLPARDGTEALKLLEESLVVKDGATPTSNIDVVISDWMMVEMDGPELCNRLRQNPATARLPFILLTAKTDSQSKVQAMEAGVDAFIEKPFPVKYLEACVRNLLRRTTA